MEHHNSENNFLSILFGAIAGTISFIMDYNVEVILFGIGLLKACIYGLAGGLFGKLATEIWEKYVTKKKRNNVNYK